MDGPRWDFCDYCMWAPSGTTLCHCCEDGDQFEEVDDEYGNDPWLTKRRVIEIKEVA